MFFLYFIRVPIYLSSNNVKPLLNVHKFIKQNFLSGFKDNYKPLSHRLLLNLNLKALFINHYETSICHLWCDRIFFTGTCHPQSCFLHLFQSSCLLRLVLHVLRLPRVVLLQFNKSVLMARIWIVNAIILSGASEHMFLIVRYCYRSFKQL